MGKDRHLTPRVGDYVYLPGGAWATSDTYPFDRTWVVFKLSRTTGRIVAIDNYTKEATIEWYDNKYYPRAEDEAKVTTVDYALFHLRYDHNNDGFMLRSHDIF